MISNYDRFLTNHRQYLASELGKQRDQFLKNKGWIRITPSASRSKEPELGLCVSYRRPLKDGKKYRKIRIYSDGKIREFLGRDMIREFKQWEDFLIYQSTAQCSFHSHWLGGW